MEEDNKSKLDPNILEGTVDEPKLANYQSLNRENQFNYIRWQVSMWTDQNIKEIGKTAMMHLIHNNYQLEIQ